jgi:hypothetical protein
MRQVADVLARTAVLHVQRGVGLADVIVVAVPATGGTGDGTRFAATIVAYAVVVSITGLPGAAALALVATAVDVRLLAVSLAVTAARFDTNVVGADTAGAVVVLQTAIAGPALLAVRTATVHAGLPWALLLVGARLELTLVVDTRLREAVIVYGAIPPVLAGLAHASAIDVGLATVPIAVFAQLLTRGAATAAAGVARDFERGRVARSSSSKRGRK